MMTLSLTVIALVSPFLIYWYVIRPRLQARFVDTYADLDSFWARQWARIVAFRTWIIGTVGLILPELLNGLILIVHAIGGAAGGDIAFLPDWIQTLIRGAALVSLMVNQGRKTTPVDEPEPEES